MDRSWIFIKNRCRKEYYDGMNSFLNVARNHLNSEGKTLCPCTLCLNNIRHTIETIRNHIILNGFTTTYTKWYNHGDSFDYNDDNGSSDEKGDESDCDEVRAAINDAAGPSFVSLGENTNDPEEPPMTFDKSRYDKMFNELESKLYPGCNDFSTLTFVVKLMHIKVLNKWSDKSFTMLLSLIKQVLPHQNRCPESYYECKKLLLELGLGYENIDVCPHDCALYYGDNKDLQHCPICQHQRYKRKNVPYKRLRYFPITPRLKRLYSSKHTSKAMRWHKEFRDPDDERLRHPADGLAWKHFDETFPDFAKDCRNVRLGLASDGFNPFGNMSTAYSCWPVILIPYNLHPWKIMKQPNYFMSLLIPGPKSSGKDFDIFMRPLIDELKQLWNVGVQAYDSHTRQLFNLRAAVLWTINDFPAYA
ncbi:hypothetical protein UlMin_010775 [Ulmus minor]